MRERIRNLVTQAVEIVDGVASPKLKEIAFARILDHLLQNLGNGTEESSPATRHPRGPASEREKRKPPVSRKAGRAGPKSWTEALIESGYFAGPRTTQDIIEALAERGHRVKRTDLTEPLQDLTRARRLSRKKAEDRRGKAVWHYAASDR